MQEYVFKIRSDDNLLCQFTAANPEIKLIITLLRPLAHGGVEKAIVTMLADKRTRTRFLAGEFGRRYGTYEILSEDENYASVEISTAVLQYYQQHDPIQLTIRMLGPETIFQPVIVQGGYIIISVMSPNPAGIEAFNAFTGHMRKVVPADDFKLLRVGPYEPHIHDAREQLTPRQQEVLRMAYAMGYYANPRATTLQQLADSLGVSKAAVHRRLQLAENALIRRHLGGN